MCWRRTETTDKFSENNDIGTLCDFWLQGGILQKSLGSEIGRSDISIQVKSFSKSQDSLFRSDRSDTPFGSSNSSYSVSSTLINVMD